MNERMQSLLSKLREYKSGDLITAVEIIDICTSLKSESDTSGEVAQRIDLVGSIFNRIIKQVVKKQDLEELQRIVTALERECGPEVSDTGEVDGREVDTDAPHKIQKQDHHKNESTAKQKPAEAFLKNGDPAVLLSFIQESLEHLDNIEGKILRLETDYTEETVNAVFRSMHTIKGTSSFLGLTEIEKLSHQLESTLDSLRSEKISINSDLVDVLLEGVDLLGKMIAILDRETRDTVQINTADLLSHLRQETMSIITRLEKFKEPQTENYSAEGLERLTKEEMITPEMIEEFISESTDLVDISEKEILELEKNLDAADAARQINTIFGAIHTVKGNAGFFGHEKLEKVCMETESMLDSIRKDTKKLNHRAVTTLLSDLDTIRGILNSLDHGNKEVSPPVSKEPKRSTESPLAKPIGEILVDMGEISSDTVDAALDVQNRKIGEILVDEGLISQDNLKKALVEQDKAAADAEGLGVALMEGKRKAIRVNTKKLDRLFDLMGELITAEAMLLDNPVIKELGFESTHAAAYLSKITREMQETTMSIRMIPLEGLFNKMKRLVRDLSRKFEKKVRLTIGGQDTEMDKNVIEEISDPLVHIIRNSLDHGIEEAPVRKRRGKPEMGTISLDARYEGSEIWISIRDDGAGLDRENILKKAAGKDLLKEKPEDIQNNEVWMLIFEPGFSTSEQVSEVSGRGVGMDVVRRNIEKLHGKINISTKPGEGTEFILKIPLTMAIIDGVTVRIGKTLYALSMADILEFQKVIPSQITKTEVNREILRLRDDTIPIIRLQNFFMTESETEITHGILIVSLSHGKKVALLVDEIVGYQQIVVKALPEYITNMRGISGCSVMGNGEVSLIIDVNSLLNEELSR